MFHFALPQPFVTALSSVCLSAVLFLPFSVHSETIYKSTDSQGNVSYSSKPSTNAVKVESMAPDPAPDEEDVQRAEQEMADYEKQELEDRQKAFELRKLRLKAEAAQARERANRRASQPQYIPYPVPVWGGGYYDYGDYYPPIYEPTRPIFPSHSPRSKPRISPVSPSRSR